MHVPSTQQVLPSRYTNVTIWDAGLLSEHCVLLEYRATFYALLSKAVAAISRDHAPFPSNLNLPKHFRKYATAICRIIIRQTSPSEVHFGNDFKAKVSLYVTEY